MPEPEDEQDALETIDTKKSKKVSSAKKKQQK